MIAITGASGQTGHVAAKILLSRGQKVRVLGRHAAKLAPLVALGAEARVFEFHDEVAMTDAFTGADAVYALNPPNPTADDIIGNYDRNSEALVAAIKGSGVKHVVTLSSIAAQLSEGNGPVLGLYRMEQKINSIPHLNVRHLRPAYFMENSLAQIAVIQKFGSVAGIIKPNLKFPMIATKDIGAVAADELERHDFIGISTRELLGSRDISMNEAAKIIGAGIGKPELSYMEPPVAMFVMALRQAGMSANMAELIAEMCLSINSGVFRGEEPRAARNTTPTTFETFVAEVFAPAFRGGKAVSA
jgi:uncharacterized protein YbjT (DUF2867 family)